MPSGDESESDRVAVLPDEDGEPEREGRQVRARPGRRWLEWLGVLLVAAVIAFLVRTFAVETFYIPSASMTPTLLTGDRILVDKLPWVRDDIHRGDVVVFRRVPKDPDVQDADLVKRVVGLPGETIWSKGDTIYVDGKAIGEPWLPDLDGPIARRNGCPQASFDIKRTRIPPGQFFVMGDCRGISYDSRYWGTVPASYVVGKVFVVIWRNGHPWLDWL